MKIAVLKEAVDHERRVPIVPESIKRLAQKKIEVLVESGAGERAHASDADYGKEGASVMGSAREVLAAADAVVKIRVPRLEDVAALREESILVAPLSPHVW